MRIIELSVTTDHERVLVAEDEASDYRGIIAIHNSRLGPAVGGTRVWPYSSMEEALDDALRLSRGMSYKSAAAGLPLGGGKSVIFGDTRTMDRQAIFTAHGRFVESLAGAYITAEDVGTSPADMQIVRRQTPYVAGLPELSGDPSAPTAHGVFAAMRAAAVEKWGTDDLHGRTVAVQGCGHVGQFLARDVRDAGASLIVADIDDQRTASLVRDLGARRVLPAEIARTQADIFAPCALGGIINDASIPELRAAIVCGAANNQLRDSRHGDALAANGVLYAPDYIANAGGIINGCRELLGWDEDRSARAVQGIRDTMAEVFALARREGIPTYVAADRIAEGRLGVTTV